MQHTADTRRRRPLKGGRAIARAFTLLEVMVAIAVLAVGVVVLLQSQARSILMAQQARTLTVATMLARGKLLDCEADLMKKGFSIGDYKEMGRFDDEKYPQFLWECHAYKPDLPMPDAADFAEAPSASAMGTGSDPMSGMPADPSGGMAMGMMGPVLGQISQVVGESIRELAVIVRWQEGIMWESLIVTTHVVDTNGVNAIAQQMQALTGGGIPGLPGAGAGGGAGGGTGSTRGGASPTPPTGAYPPGVSPTPPPFTPRGGK
jgi:prepilin-type N-terminal cleavage/methylation domain-containing protein